MGGNGAMGGANESSQPAGVELDLEKFENVHQVGGIQTALIETPGFGSGSGAGRPSRVAFVNTGSGLRFTVALDRGGDILDASYNRYGLAFLAAGGLVPPEKAYDSGVEWLRGFPGGLLTTCGPIHIGRPRVEDGQQVTLHGHHSNTPASVEMVINPDPHRRRHEMLLAMTVRDSRMFGPVVEVRRTIQCTLGVPTIQLYDQVTNRGNTTCAHNYLYHVNLGYPLLDAGARLIYGGQATYWQAPAAKKAPTAKELTAMKRVPEPLAEHVGGGERGLVVEMEPDGEGMCHAGLINEKLGLGFELEFPAESLPRIANWQHFGPRGNYVTGIEPFAGSLMGKESDKYARAALVLEPGQTARYSLTMRVCEGAGLARLAGFDGGVRV